MSLNPNHFPPGVSAGPIVPIAQNIIDGVYQTPQVRAAKRADMLAGKTAAATSAASGIADDTVPSTPTASTSSTSSGTTIAGHSMVWWATVVFIGIAGYFAYRHFSKKHDTNHS